MTSDSGDDWQRLVEALRGYEHRTEGMDNETTAGLGRVAWGEENFGLLAPFRLSLGV